MHWPIDFGKVKYGTLNIRGRQMKYQSISRLETRSKECYMKTSILVLNHDA